MYGNQVFCSFDGSYIHRLASTYPVHG